jgi:hypothetical protein
MYILQNKMLFVWPFKIIENIFNLKDERGEISLVKSDEGKNKVDRIDRAI